MLPVLKSFGKKNLKLIGLCVEKKSKILLRKHHLKVGTVFKTVNRFYPHKDWIIHKIEKLDLKNDTAQLSVLGWSNVYHDIDYSRFHPIIGTTTMFTNISYHCVHNNTAYIDYYLPAGDIFYCKMKKGPTKRGGEPE